MRCVMSVAEIAHDNEKTIDAIRDAISDVFLGRKTSD